MKKFLVHDALKYITGTYSYTYDFTINSPSGAEISRRLITVTTISYQGHCILLQTLRFFS